MLLLTQYPFLNMLYISFTKYNLLWDPYPVFNGIENYVKAFTDPILQSSIKVTGLIIAASVPSEFVLGLLIAFLIDSLSVGKNVIRSLIIIPMVLPPIVSGIAWRLIFNPEYGPLNFFLNLFYNIGKIEWLGEPLPAVISIIISDIWQWTPFMFLIFYASLQSFPSDLRDAAYVDGASYLQLMAHVILPELMPVMSMALLLRLIDSLKIFDTVYMLTYGGPGYATHVLSFYIYKVAFKYMEMGYASCLALLLLLIDLVLVYALIKLLRIGEALGVK